MSEALKPILKAMRFAYYQAIRDSKLQSCYYESFKRTEAELDELFRIIAEECLLEIREKKAGSESNDT